MGSKLRILRSFLLSVLCAAAALAAVPKVGDPAPEFGLPSTRGVNVALKDYAGKSNVVLVFYRGHW
jgi:hypothetical protein